MDKQTIKDVKPKVLKVIELVEKEQEQYSEKKEKKEIHSLGESLEELKDYLEGDNPHNDLVEYLDSLKIEKLKIINSLMLTGRDVVDGEEFEEEIFDDYYKYSEENKDALVGYISEKSLRLNDYLKTGLEYCLK